ncbi:salicylate hydroxylase [Pyrenophora seminiperda CCB06]|uniref:Salicylate hydroxylase n=1 Tax=Pyrenophora seminiperda CCB06 TaxID=1302712 RepID=A0A3M7M664_9PLEO|nr:salicylate hydroxylase [Pyrenophora seminiperda CCB06]
MPPSAISVSPSAKPAPLRLHVLVIGAGLFGLGAAISICLAGHDVTVLESVPSLEEVGAGLQITPNGTRILKSWGVDKLLSAVTAPATFSIHRFDGSRILAHRQDYAAELEERHGSPLWCLHRAQLQEALASRAKSLGAEIRLNARVSHVDPDTGEVELESGETVQGQLIVGADGLWSTTRAALYPDSPDQTPLPLPTGDLAYRIIIDRESDQGIDGILHERFFVHPGIHIWVGPGSHAVAYSMQDGRYLNVVLLVPDNLPPLVAKAEGDLNEMHALFHQWDPM